MAIFYWKGAGAGDGGAWSNILNWFKDEALTVPAGAFPAASTDIAIIPPTGAASDITTLGAARNIGVFLDLGDGTAAYAANDYTLTAIGANFIGAGSYNNGTIAAPCLFISAGAGNSGTVTGPCLFGDNSVQGYGGAIAGPCLFYGSASIFTGGGTINGDCLFAGAASANVNGAITGCCIFTGTGARNSSLITGDALFARGTGMTCSGTISGSLLPLVPITSSGTAGKYPLDVLGAGF